MLCLKGFHVRGETSCQRRFRFLIVNKRKRHIHVEVQQNYIKVVCMGIMSIVPLN